MDKEALNKELEAFFDSIWVKKTDNLHLLFLAMVKPLNKTTTEEQRVAVKYSHVVEVT